METNLTPAEVAEQTGATSEYHIRRLCAQRRIAHTRGARGRITLTPDQVQALLEYLAVHPEVSQIEHPDAPTARSLAYHRNHRRAS